MMVRAAGCATLALLALAGCSKGSDDPAGSSDGWSIAAGRYSNLSADNIGMELTLAQGDRSTAGTFLRCVEACDAEAAEAAQDVSLRRGLNGVSFSLSGMAKAVDVTVTPASATSVSVSANWGDGLETVELPLKP